MISRWRRRIGALVGGFEAGEASRRLRHFQPSRAHLNTLIAAAGADITARARWLVKNNGYAANAVGESEGRALTTWPSLAPAETFLSAFGSVDAVKPDPLAVDFDGVTVNHACLAGYARRVRRERRGQQKD